MRVLLRFLVLMFLSLPSPALIAKSAEEAYSIRILDFYTPVLSEAENAHFFENLMGHLTIYAVYCTTEDAPRSVLRKKREYKPSKRSHIPTLDFKDIFRKQYKTVYYQKCQAREVTVKSADKNLMQLDSLMAYKYHELVGLQIEVMPAFMSQYTLLNNSYVDSIMRSIHSNGAEEGDYYYLVGQAERFFLPLEKVNSSHKASYLKEVKKDYRGEELLKSVGLSKTPVSIIAIVVDTQGAGHLDLNEKLTVNDKLALIDKIEYDEMHTEVDLKSSFDIYSQSKVYGTYANTPDAQVLHISGDIDKNAEWNRGINVRIYETWRSYKGDVVSISGNLESRNRFHCRASYNLRFNPDGTNDRTFKAHTGYDVLKPYDGTKENIKNMKEIIQQYQYTQASDPLGECDKVVEYMQTIFSSSQEELSRKMAEMGEIIYIKNTERRKEQYLAWEEHGG